MTTEATGARRANPFDMEEEGDDPIAAAALISSPTRPPDPVVIRTLAETRGFPSREPAPTFMQHPPATPARPRRVHRTGRNRQLTIKVSEEAFTQFYDMADKQGVVLGEAFQQALDAWAEKLARSAP